MQCVHTNVVRQSVQCFPIQQQTIQYFTTNTLANAKQFPQCVLNRGGHRKIGVEQQFQPLQSLLALGFGSVHRYPAQLHLRHTGRLRQPIQRKAQRTVAANQSRHAIRRRRKGVVHENLIRN